MESKELKQRMYEDGTIGKLLDELECGHIKTHRNGSGDTLVTASLPDGDNPKGVQIYLNENLTTNLVTRGITGDVYSLVGYILFDADSFDDVKKNFYQITQYICNTLGYENNKDFTKETKPKNDWNWWLRPIQERREREYEIVENPTLSNKILSEFVPYPWYGWFEKERISHQTQLDFNIGYHVPTDRISIPLHNKKGELIGVKGRYVGANELIEEEKKYSYLYRCSKTIELFNLHRAMPFIEEKKEIVVFEGAKTVIMAWENGVKNTVSIEGDKLSPVQVLLLKECGLDIRFVFAWDKDKDEEYIQKQIKQVKNRKVFYLLDKQDRFSGKDSPFDKGLSEFLDMYQHDKYQYR